MPDFRERGILRLAMPRLSRFLPGLLAGLVGALSAVGLLAASSWLITRAAEQPPILYLSTAVVGVRAFALGRAGFRYLERLLSHDAAFRQLSDLRQGVFNRLVPRAPAGLSGIARGDLLARLVRDVDGLQDLPLRVVQPLTTALLVAALSIVGVWLVLPAAALTLAACLVLAAVLGAWLSGALAARSERSIAPLRGALTDGVLEVVENIDVLTAYGSLEDRLAALAAVDRRLRRAELRRSLGAGLQAAVTSLFAGVATLAALIVGIPELGIPVEPGTVTIPDITGLSGPLFAVIVLVPMAVFEVYAAVPAALSAWRQVRSNAERVATAVPDDVPAEIPVEDPATERRSLNPFVAPVLELDDVGASWPGKLRPAVEGVTFRLAPGERMHLSGPSGSGKTTLANALVRFLDYTGSYRIGGMEARELSQAEVRSVVGLCEQRPWLFDDTIRQNLLFANDTATDEDLLAVLDRVGLADWMRLRGGLDARVGERGALVSGGQAQRIALARALLAGFPVLIVDEPTANVDAAQADRLVRDLLSAAAADDRAVLLISHTPVPDDLITTRVTLRAPEHTHPGFPSPEGG